MRRFDSRSSQPAAWRQKREPTRVQYLDITIAHKVINLAPNLTAADKQVAGAIIDHFNRLTAQCDPSLDRIASLLAVSRRTVIRSVEKLVGSKMFCKVRHGGNLHRNSYTPNWSHLREMDAAWGVRMKEQSQRRATKLSPSKGQDSHLAGDRAGTQTILNNHLKETHGQTSTENLRLRSESSQDGLAMKSSFIPSPTPARTQKSVDRQQSGISSREALRMAAERRWNTALLQRYGGTPEVYGHIIAAVDQPLIERTTEMEIQRSGCGLSFLIKELILRQVLPATEES